jgi:hypothetical protein
MILPPLLAANWDELISFGVGLVFLLVWLVNQIAEAKKKKAPPPPLPEVGPQEPNAKGPPPAAKDPHRNQVDEFLRRVNERAREIAGEPPQPAAPPKGRSIAGEEIVVLLDEAPPESRRRGRTPTLQPAAPSSPSQGSLRRERRSKDKRGKSVAEHVAERVGSSTRQMREEVAHLGERVIQADKQFDVQLEQKFGHRLGSLSEQSAESVYQESSTPATSTPAAQIAALLASPEGVRQAIVLNEILRRPEDRW